MTARFRLAAAVSLVGAAAWLAAGALSAQQVRDRVATPPPANAVAAAGGGAVVSGTLMSDELTPQPVRRAQVSLISSDATVARNMLTDAAGRFAFADLPAGRFTLAASKPGWVRTSYGAKRYDRPGTTITLTDGQKMTGVAMKMAHGGVIAGTILDENGLPAQGVQVRIMQYRVLNGERTLAPVTAGALFGETTDDRGAYRLFGLPAGDYVVSAQPRLANAGEIRAMTQAEIRAALVALQQPNAPSSTVNATAGAPAAPPPATPRPDPETVGYTAVYYPGAVTASGAATVALAPGEERTGVDFSLQLVRTAKVEGTIVAPSGVPAQNVQLTMVPTSNSGSLAAIGPTLLNRATAGPDGKFTYTAIPPGQYTIMARATRPAGGGAGAPPARVATEDVIGFAVQGVGRGGGGGGGGNLDMMIGPLGDQSSQFWAMADVTVDGSPVSGIVLTLQPGMTLTGRVEFASTRGTPPADLARVRVTLAQAPMPGGMNIVLGAPLAQIDASGKFTVSGVTPGRYRLNGVAPAPPGAGPGQTWTLKSAIVKGKDVLDFPLEIGPGEEIADAVLTFTDVTQQVSGTLQDATGRPAPDYTIVVFAADKVYWTATSRRIRTARPGTDGKFTVTNLPPGDYRIAAVTDVAPNEVNDPAFLEQLVGASIPITLTEGDRKVQDIRIKGS